MNPLLLKHRTQPTPNYNRILSNIVFQHLISEKFSFVILEDAQIDNTEETQCYLFTQVFITIQIIKAKLVSHGFQECHPKRK